MNYDDIYQKIKKFFIEINSIHTENSCIRYSWHTSNCSITVRRRYMEKITHEWVFHDQYWKFIIVEREKRLEEFLRTLKEDKFNIEIKMNDYHIL